MKDVFGCVVGYQLNYFINGQTSFISIWISDDVDYTVVGFNIATKFRLQPRGFDSFWKMMKGIRLRITMWRNEWNYPLGSPGPSIHNWMHNSTANGHLLLMPSCTCTRELFLKRISIGTHETIDERSWSLKKT